MSLWDPEAAGNAAIFLRLDDMKMLEIRNAPFEGAKAVWVPNSETGYIKAEVIGKGDKPNTTKVSLTFPEIHFNSCISFWTIYLTVSPQMRLSSEFDFLRPSYDSLDIRSEVERNFEKFCVRSPF